MILPDVNVLIYAFRVDAALHDVCKSWLEDIVNGEAQFGISPLALSAVVRITTNPRAFPEPSTVEEAFSYCNALLGRPNCTVVQPGERHWSIFERLCAATNTRGRRTTDAWFAALAIEHGCTWITHDCDYARFPGLDWRAPVE
jgi:toxin-antitoxin system PIN domain toxin